LDVNWLYSAAAQSAAAIVAILGGFITSRILMLNAEKRSLQNQYNSVTKRVELLIAQEREAYDQYYTMKSGLFFDTISDELRKTDPMPPFEDLTKKYHRLIVDINPTILRREYDKLSKEILEARQFIQDRYNLIERALSFDEWVNKHGIDISSYDYEALEHEYLRVREEKEEEQKGSVIQSIVGSIVGGNTFWTPSPEISVYRQQVQDRMIEKSVDRVKELRYQADFAKAESERFKTQLDAFSYPKNLKWGFLTIAYFAVVGVAVPLFMLPSEGYSPWSRYIVTGLFMTGLAAVLAYIGIQLNELLK
jgi:hypothetical protein